MLCCSGGLHAFYAAYSSLCSSPDEPPSRPFLFSPTTPIVEVDVDLAEMSQILPFLFLGKNVNPLVIPPHSRDRCVAVSGEVSEKKFQGRPFKSKFHYAV